MIGVGTRFEKKKNEIRFESKLENSIPKIERIINVIRWLFLFLWYK